MSRECASDSSQCYARFQFFWSQVIGLGNVCMEWTTLVAVYLPDDPTVRWNCTRFLLASMHILFFMVNSHKDEGEGRVIDDDHHESSLISEAEWRMLLQRYLLTPEECSIINEYKGLASGLPITWALAEVEAVFSSVSPANMQDKRSPPERASILASFRALAFRMRNHCREIKQTLQMPVPFPYFQFLVRASMLALKLACKLACTPKMALAKRPPVAPSRIPHTLRRSCSASTWCSSRTPSSPSTTNGSSR